jgi:dUTP pyrophosphatase
MKVKIKLFDKDARIPTYGHSGDAGMDLTAISVAHNPEHNYYEYDTGIGLEIPHGYYGAVVPRSSISKTSMILCNSPGTIDSGYTGSIKLRFKLLDPHGKRYAVGDKLAQLIILKCQEATLELVDTLELTERGVNGFGSTGN